MARTRTRTGARSDSTIGTSRTNRSLPRVSYAESTSNSDDEDDFEDSDSDSESGHPASQRPTRSRNLREGSSHTKSRVQPKRERKSSATAEKLEPNSKRLRTRGRPRPGTSPKKVKAVPQVDDSIQYSGFVPQWQSLPYHVWVEVFRYASYPLYNDQTFQPLPSGRWLLNVARLCKAFAEPAFTVLYTSPPLVPMDKAHMLVELLKMDPTKLAFKYRQKVETLRIDVGQVAAYSLGAGLGHLDLYSLVKDLPRLTDLEFYHQKDMSPYRDLDASIKWSYPPALFDALEYVDPQADPLRGDKSSICKLRSWRWSSRLAGKEYPIESIRQIHLKPSFSELRKLAFVNYQVPELKKGVEISPPQHEEILADALSVLPRLLHLIFESCTLLNSTLLPLLPQNLHSLELINCWEVRSEDFEAFILTHGSQLRAITLNHNISLSLSFLPSLGPSCPKLEVFRVNLNYYNVHSFYHDSKPGYKDLLLHSEVPVWPSTLQTLELIQLRQWETEAAQMFFQSLLDSAIILRDLRVLILQATINISWRDRASFRDKWIGALDRVFNRISAPPKVITTLRPTSKSKPIPISSDDDGNVGEPKAPLLSRRKSLRSSSGDSSSEAGLTLQVRLPREEEPTIHRKSTRHALHTSQENTRVRSNDHDVDPDAPEAKRHVRRSKRMARELSTLQQTAGFHGAAELVHTRDVQEEFVQGMCEIVQVRIDNLRPAENLVTEADFLDEEAPGDADWDGNDEEIEGYAW